VVIKRRTTEYVTVSFRIDKDTYDRIEVIAHNLLNDNIEVFLLAAIRSTVLAFGVIQHFGPERGVMKAASETFRKCFNIR